MVEAAEGAQERERAARVDPRPHDDEAQALARLRAILVGEELERFERRMRERRLDAREVARVLPEAVLVRATQDDWLARSLEAPVERALGRSIERNATRIAELMKPVIGPLVRKGVRHVLASMLQQFNRALEHSCTLTGLRWRIEARRTGRPFSEVVLLHSLEYRVEQVFLIHRPTGLLLQRVVAPAVEQQDGDMVAAMITAIRDFVQDSFPGSDSGDVASVQVGEMRIVAQADERAILAAVVRGVPPADLSERLWTTLEQILLERGDDLQEFRGDSSAFVATRPLLEDRLEQRFARMGRRRPLAILYIALLGLAALAPIAFVASVRWFERREWRAAMQVLESEPGIVVSSWWRRDGQWVVTGLRDPDAREPHEVLAGVAVEFEGADFRLERYLSLDDAVLARRATRFFAPPAGVTLRVKDCVLQVPRNAPSTWRDATLDARYLPGGIRRVEVESDER